MAERVSQAEAEAAARKRADEQLEEIRGKVELLQTKAAATAASTSGATDPAEVRELKKYNDDLLVSRLRTRLPSSETLAHLILDRSACSAAALATLAGGLASSLAAVTHSAANVSTRGCPLAHVAAAPAGPALPHPTSAPCISEPHPSFRTRKLLFVT